MSTSGGSSGGGGLSVATAHLDPDAIGTLSSTPIELIAAPAPNRIILIVAIIYQCTLGNTSWRQPAGGLYYGDPADNLFIDQQMLNLDMMSLTGVGAQITQPHPEHAVNWATTQAVEAAVNIGTSNPTDPEPISPIATLDIAAAGADYAPGDTGTIDSALFGTNTGYVVDTVDGGGAVTALHLALSSAGYDPADSPFATTAGGAQPGIGTGLEIDVLTIQAATGDLYVAAYYQTAITN